MELRNGVHKYQPIVLAAGSIAPEPRKSMIMPCYLRRQGGVLAPDKSQKCQVQPDLAVSLSTPAFLVPYRYLLHRFGCDVTVRCVTLLSEINACAG